MLQFGQTCSLPLGRNCPWAIGAPAFFSLYVQHPSRAPDGYVAIVVSQNASLDVATWMAGPHPTTPSVGPINQIIFPFPMSSYEALASRRNSSAFAAFASGVRPGTVRAFSASFSGLNVSTLPSTTFTTRTGNVSGVTGYYIYTSSGKVTFADGDVVFVPADVVALMPRRAGTDLIEYSFYGSEAYCLIQTISIAIDSS